MSSCLLNSSGTHGGDQRLERPVAMLPGHGKYSIIFHAWLFIDASLVALVCFLQSLLHSFRISSVLRIASLSGFSGEALSLASPFNSRYYVVAVWCDVAASCAHHFVPARQLWFALHFCRLSDCRLGWCQDAHPILRLDFQ